MTNTETTTTRKVIARGTRLQASEAVADWNEGADLDFGPATLRFIAGLGWVATVTQWA